MILEAKDKELLFNIIKSGMLNEKMDLSSLEEESDLFRVIKEQTFHPFLYYISKDRRFKKYFLSSYLLVEQFDKLAILIKSLFDKEGIDHIFLKGYELRKLYPNPALRLSGDLDVIVRVEDYERAKKVLQDNQFVFENESDNHAGFIFNNLEIELHRYLTSNNIYFYEMLRKPFENATQQDNHTYIFDVTFNFFFILSHHIKHLYSGTGIRELCDVYIMLDKLDVDMDKLSILLKQAELTEFFQTVLTELNILFGFNKYSFVYNEYAKNLLDYCVGAGVHGFGEDNYYEYNLNNNKKQKSKFSFLLTRWFIPLKELFKLYPWTKSIILIPFGYIVRFFDILFRRFDKLKKVVNSNNDNSNLFKNIGLKD